MKKTKKALASLAIMGMVATMVPFNAFASTGVTTDRIFGTDRIATANLIADSFAAPTAAILAPSTDAHLVDALASAPLAGMNSPILLTESDTLNAATKVELAKLIVLGVKTVYVVGAIDQAVADQVTAMGVTATPLKGTDRTDTAAAITAKLTSPAGSFVVGYNALADALSVASYAAAHNYSIVVANPDGTIPATETIATSNVYVLGGPTLVKDVTGATRLAGLDRFDTNKVVLDTLYGSTASFSKVYVSNGTDEHLVDSLAVASLAAFAGAPVVLTDTVTGGDATATDINAKLADNAVVVALGGETVVSATTLNKVAVGVVPATLSVSSVSATNLKQVVVTYNQVVTDNDEAKDNANYTFEGVAVGESDAAEIAVSDVDVNGKVVTLTLEDAVENQTEGTLTVDANVLGEDLEFANIELFDTTIPTVVGAEVVGNDTIKVKFSEPIDFTDNLEDSFSLNDGEFFVKSVTPMNNNTEANVEFYTEFENADYTISVNNDLEDYAGFNVVAKDVALTVVVDTTAPEIVSYKDVTPTKITLVFDGDIEPADGADTLDKLKFFHTNSSNHALTATVVNGNEIDLTFDADHELPNGTAYVYVDDEAIQDLWDNVNEQRLSIAVNVVVDTTAPKVSDLEVTTQAAITLTFNEELDEVSAETEANFTLIDADGDEVKVTNATLQANDDGDFVEVKLTLADKIYGDLTLTVEDVEDVAGNAMSAQNLDFNAEDETPPVFSAFGATLYSVDNDIYTIVVDFDEEMSVEGKYSVVDLEKYVINTVNLADVDSDDIKIVALDSNKQVKIELKKVNSEELLVSAEDDITIARIADAAGNYTADLVGTKNIAAAATVKIDKVEATDNNEVVITLDGKVSKFEANDFIVFDTTTSSALSLVGARVNNSGDDSVITITLNADVNELTDDGKYNGSTIAVKTATDEDNVVNTKNSYGEKVAIADGELDAVVKDKINPELAQYDLNDEDVDDVAVGTHQVVLTFSEDIDALTVSKYSFKVQDITVTGVLVEGNKITLTVDSDDTDQPTIGTSVTQALAIYDTAGNALTGISTDVTHAID